jgi:hypothetical protein
MQALYVKTKLAGDVTTFSHEYCQKTKMNEQYQTSKVQLRYQYNA